MHLPISFRIVLCPSLLAGSVSLEAQAQQPRRLDLGGYVHLRALAQGQYRRELLDARYSIQIGANVWRWGHVADVTGIHAGSIGSSGIPISLVTTSFGPRYRWHADRTLSLYGQGLIGEANGFRSVFPAQAGSQSGSNSLAIQTGGGIDYKLSDRVAIRVLDGAWLRTQLPNSTDNVQNNLRLGAGIVVRFAR